MAATAAAVVVRPVTPVQASLWSDAWRRLRRNRLALGGTIYLTFLVAVALIALVWTPYPMAGVAVAAPYSGPSPAHWFGADLLGRDVLSRVMVGAQISLTVGIGTQLIVLLGHPGLDKIIIAISVTRWMDMTRLVRGQTLALREREFIEAARASGAKPIKILFGHILPNALGPVIVQATFGVPAAILFEAFLSFLGLGVPPPQPSWGSMAADGLSAIRIAPHMVIAPSIALSLTLMAFNFLGDGLRDALDPRSRR